MQLTQPPTPSATPMARLFCAMKNQSSPPLAILSGCGRTNEPAVSDSTALHASTAAGRGEELRPSAAASAHACTAQLMHQVRPAAGEAQGGVDG